MNTSFHRSGTPAISQKRIAALLKTASSAAPTKTQGDAFEELLCYIFGRVPGVSVSARNRKSVDGSEEIDIAFWNEKVRGGFFFLPHIILAECKHWSKPVGSAQVTWFDSKVRGRGLDFGVLFAHKGITGNATDRRDAQAVVMRSLSENRRLLVLTTTDLRSLSTSSDLILMVKLKLCELTVGGGI
jgi:hypothetical protein